MKQASTFILLILIASSCLAQKKNKGEPLTSIPFDTLTEKYTYTKVVEVDETAPTTLYERCKSFCVKKYSDEDFSIDEQNKKLADNGKFEVTVMFPGGIPVTYTAKYQLIVEFKEGRYRYQITNISYGKADYEETIEALIKSVDNLKGAGKKAGKRAAKSVCEQIEEHLKKVMEQFEAGMQKEKSDSDW